MSMTTELAQRMKAEISALDDTQWYLAKPSEIRSLVEALEARDKQIAELRVSNRILCSDAMAKQDRITVLEARTVKLPSLNPKMFNDAVMFGYLKAQKEVVEFCAAAGISVTVEGE